MKTRLAQLETSALKRLRQVRVICNTEDRGRDGLLLRTAGIDLEEYRANPVVLWQHEAEYPIARTVSIMPVKDQLIAIVQFPPEGISPRADESYGLVCNGVVNAVSIGFEIVDSEPAKTGDRGHRDITQSRLMEISFVSIPALQTALVTDRARQGRTGREDSSYHEERLARQLLARPQMFGMVAAAAMELSGSPTGVELDQFTVLRLARTLRALGRGLARTAERELRCVHSERSVADVHAAARAARVLFGGARRK